MPNTYNVILCTASFLIVFRGFFCCCFSGFFYSSLVPRQFSILLISLFTACNLLFNSRRHKPKKVTRRQKGGQSNPFPPLLTPFIRLTWYLAHLISLYFQLIRITWCLIGFHGNHNHINVLLNGYNPTRGQSHVKTYKTSNQLQQIIFLEHSIYIVYSIDISNKWEKAYYRY